MTSWNLIRTLLKNVLSDSHRVQDPHQCFPKSSLLNLFVSQGFLFWSARKKTYVCCKTIKKILKSIFFSHLFIKLSIKPTSFLFMVCGTILKWFCGLPKYFSVFFLVCKLNKFGKPQASQKLQDSPSPRNKHFFWIQTVRLN